MYAQKLKISRNVFQVLLVMLFVAVTQPTSASPHFGKWHTLQGDDPEDNRQRYERQDPLVRFGFKELIEREKQAREVVPPVRSFDGVVYLQKRVVELFGLNPTEEKLIYVGGFERIPGFSERSGFTFSSKEAGHITDYKYLLFEGAYLVRVSDGEVFQVNRHHEKVQLGRVKFFEGQRVIELLDMKGSLKAVTEDRIVVSMQSSSHLCKMMASRSATRKI